MIVYTNSPLVTKTRLSTKWNPRTGPITKITIHHAAGCMTMERLLDYVVDVSRDMSANYVLSGGKLGLCVEEKNRAWTSSSPANDYQAVTIEVANSSSGGTWPISDADLNMLVKWCADVCSRNDIPSLYYDGTPNGSLTLHQMFYPTACPGAYIKSKIPYICDAVNKILNGETVNPATTQHTSTYDVVVSLYGYVTAADAVNDRNRKRIVKPGTYYVYNATSDAINVTAVQGIPGAWIAKSKNKTVSTSNTPSLDDVAKAVIRGEYGNGVDRVTRLKESGYDPSAVQELVNQMIQGTKGQKKSIDEIAKEVIAGKWGNGAARRKKLENAGYDYDKVQSVVNKMLK